MKIQIQNQHGDAAVRCNVARVVPTHGKVFMLTKQTTGDWTATVGKDLVPALNMLKSIVLTDRVGVRAVAHFNGLGTKHNVLIRYVESHSPFLHFDRHDGEQHLTMYVTSNLMRGDYWPATIEVVTDFDTEAR